MLTSKPPWHPLTVEQNQKLLHYWADQLKMFILWPKNICTTGRLLSLVLTIFDFDYWPRKIWENTGNDWMNQNKVFAWIWPEMELHEIEKIVPGGNYESCAPKLWFREENSLFSHLRWSEALVWWLPAPSWWSIIFDRCRHHRQPADVHSVHSAQCEHILILNLHLQCEQCLDDALLDAHTFFG